MTRFPPLLAGLGLWAVLTLALPLPAQTSPTGEVAVELVEGIPDKKTWDFKAPAPSERYTEAAFGFVTVPKKFSPQGLVTDRSNPLLLRATAKVDLPGGDYRFLLRARGAARLYLDEKLVAATAFLKANASGHEAVPQTPALTEAGLYPLAIAHQEKLFPIKLEGGTHSIRLETFIGGQRLRPEVGEICVCVAGAGEPFRVLSPSRTIPLTDEGWSAYAADSRARHRARDDRARKAAGAEEGRYWEQRHRLARNEWATQPAPAIADVPATIPVHNAIDRFIGQRLVAAKQAPTGLTDDAAFLRRVTLDVVGVIPTRAEILAFQQDQSPERRARVIDRLLADPRWADNWVGYWQDVLAENPGILKPTLNNTGPFRWWIHQAFLDNMPMDRFATELVMLEGSRMGGGPGGFALATQNDAPMAAKAHILSKAFLGLEMQCARCHDAPFHPFHQEQLFNVAAMLGQGMQTLPATSTVKFIEGGRRPRVTVSLRPGSRIPPAWPFEELAPADVPEGVLRDPKNPRAQLAAILTSPRNERFAQVLVNRLWKRYLGFGLVEPVDDWTDAKPSHPKLLEYLARELVLHGYDLKHVARLILNAHTYQRVVAPDGSVPVGPDERLFAAPARRRLAAEQLVDSLFLAAGKEFQAEELTLDPEGRRPITEMINLGIPRRAWEFTSLSNERDRPALALPVAQSIVDVLTTFGWRDSRQNPLTVRDETPTPLQPLLLANGVVGSRITRLSDDSALTELCLQDRPLTELVHALFLQVLSRPPTAEEKQVFVALLEDGYADRCLVGPPAPVRKRASLAAAVSWANHLSPEATRLKLEQERAVQAGDPPSDRLRGPWRERMEDVVWSLVNSPEFLFVP